MRTIIATAGIALAAALTIAAPAQASARTDAKAFAKAAHAYERAAEKVGEKTAEEVYGAYTGCRDDVLVGASEAQKENADMLAFAVVMTVLSGDLRAPHKTLVDRLAKRRSGDKALKRAAKAARRIHAIDATLGEPNRDVCRMVRLYRDSGYSDSHEPDFGVREPTRAQQRELEDAADLIDVAGTRMRKLGVKRSAVQSFVAAASFGV